jgi:hypothetical protein
MDPIVQCPRCQEYRHRSWFRAGERYCRECQDTEPEWLDSLARAVVAQEAMERERQAAIKAEADAMMNSIKPPELTSKEWRLLHRLDRGESVDSAEKNNALGKIIALAEKRLRRDGEQLGVVFDQPLDEGHGVRG